MKKEKKLMDWAKSSLVAARRDNWRRRACKAYIQKHHPEIWNAILNESYERFPNQRRQRLSEFECDFMSKVNERA